MQVVVTQTGSDHATESIHILHVGKMRMKLCKGKTTIAKEYYSSSMQVYQIVGTQLLIVLGDNSKIIFHVLSFFGL